MKPRGKLMVSVRDESGQLAVSLTPLSGLVLSFCVWLCAVTFFISLVVQFDLLNPPLWLAIALIAVCLFWFPFLFSPDRIVAKSDEIEVRLSPLYSAAFYPMNWILLTGEKKGICVVGERDGFWLCAVGHGGIFVPLYKTRKESDARRLAEILSAYYRLAAR